MLGRLRDRLTGEPSLAQGASGLDLCLIYKVTGVGVPLEHLKIVVFVPVCIEGITDVYLYIPTM